MSTIDKKVLIALLGSIMWILAGCVGGNNMASLNSSGERWVLDKLIVNGVPVALNSSQITLSFTNDSAMVGKSAVNNYRAPVSVHGGRISHEGPLITTRMAGPMPAMKLENAYFSILRKADSLDRENDVLTIKDNDGQLIFRLMP